MDTGYYAGRHRPWRTPSPATATALETEMVELKQRLERVAQLLEAHLALQKGSPEQDGPNTPDVQDTP